MSTEMMRAIEICMEEAKRIRAASPFPAGSGEPVAVGIEQMAYGCERAAQAIASTMSAPRTITYPPEMLPRADDNAEVWVCTSPTSPEKCEGGGPCPKCRLVYSSSKQKRMNA